MCYSDAQGLENWPVVKDGVTDGALLVPLVQDCHQITLDSLVVTNIRLPPL